MADYQYITATGLIVPDTGDILETVKNEYRAAFGADLVTDPSTPQGVLIVAETEARDGMVRNNAAVANQVNPNLAGGVWLDAIWALTGGARSPATRSRVDAVLTGVIGTVVPAGSLAKTLANNQFQTVTTVTIGNAGTAAAVFESVEFGAIPCGAGDLNTIVSTVLGWETVTNGDAATLGTTTQSDESARRERRQTLALQGRRLSQSIMSAIASIQGFVSQAFRENTADTTETIDGISMVGHSIYSCVDGGIDSDVAMAIAENLNGFAMNGNTDVSVTDPYSGQAYTVTFQRPADVDVLIRITAKVSASVATDPTAAIKAAVLAYANCETDDGGFVVGGDVSPFEIAAAANVVPGIFISLCEVAEAGGSPVYSTDTIAIGLDQVARTQSSSISVVLT